MALLDLWQCSACGIRCAAAPGAYPSCARCDSVTNMELVSLGTQAERPAPAARAQRHGTKARFDRWAQASFLGWCNIHD